MLIVSFILLPIALGLFGFTVYGLVLNRKTGIRKRLYDLQNNPDAEHKIKKQRKKTGKKTHPFEDLINENLYVFNKLNINMSRKEIIMLNIICAILVFMACYLGLKQLILSIVMAPIGFFLPLLIGKQMIKSRQKAFEHLFGDAMVLIANVLKSGFSLKQAFQIVAEEMPAAVAEEFSILNQEISYGLDMNEAMKNLATRMPNEYVKLFVTAVNIQSEVGGSMAEIIGKIAESIQERQAMQGELKTLTSQGKTSGIIVGLLPFGVMTFVSLMNPEFMMPLYTTLPGWIALGVVGVLELMAIVIIKGIITVE